MASVAGERWFMSYKRMLGEEKVMIRFEGILKRIFRFSNTQGLSSLGTYTIPAWIAGQFCQIKMDVIASDIPLLISKKAMNNRAKAKLDIATDVVTWEGAEVRSVLTSAGHLCVLYFQRNQKQR